MAEHHHTHHHHQHENHESHSHEHYSHSHGHSHTVVLTELNRAFIIGIILNSLFVAIEAGYGFTSHSLALITDAGHNLSDVAALGLSLFAFRMTRVKADESFTYGYSKTTVLAALVNSVILLIAIGVIGYEAVLRFLKPEPLEGGTMAIVAAVGIVVNGTTALLFFKNKDHELNAKGAYLHMAGDALVSLAVVITGVIIIYTHLYWLDSVISVVIMLVILYSTWNLLSDSLRLSLDAVPRSVDVEKVREEILHIHGVNGIHHIHVWALSTTVNAMTAHLVVNENIDSAAEQHLKEKVKHQLNHLNIQHVTLETERGKGRCEEEEC